MTTFNWSATYTELSNATLAQIWNVRSDINAVANVLDVSAIDIAAAISEEVQDQLNNGSVKSFLNSSLDLATLAQASHASIAENYAYLSSLPDTAELLIDPPKTAKLSNIGLRDVGLGNIRVVTAIDMLIEYNMAGDPLGLNQYKTDYASFVRALVNNVDGLQAKIAGLYVEQGKDFFVGKLGAVAWATYNDEQRAELLATYYNFGEAQLEATWATNTENGIIPYDPRPSDSDGALGPNSYLNLVGILNGTFVPELPDYGDLNEFIDVVDAANRGDEDAMARVLETLTGTPVDASDIFVDCFPAGTMVDIWPKDLSPTAAGQGHYTFENIAARLSQKAIEDITTADIVVSINDQGHPVPGTVDKTFTNTTQTFVELSFDDGRASLVTTPGHRFLTETGDYMEIGHMLRLGGGKARLVDTDGSIVEAIGELIVYSAETADMFDQAQTKTIAFDGNTVFKEQVEAGWQTYNFEVREHHNYVAGGIRVHNDSILSTLQPGDQLIALNGDLTDAAVLRDVDGDGVDELVLLDGERPGENTQIVRTIVLDPPAGVTDTAAYLPEADPNRTFDGIDDVQGDTITVNGQTYQIDVIGNVFDPGFGNTFGDGIKADDLEELVIDDAGFTLQSTSEPQIVLGPNVVPGSTTVEIDGLNLIFSFDLVDGTSATETVVNDLGITEVVFATGAIVAIASLPTTPEPSDNTAPVSVADDALTVEEDGTGTSVNVLANDTDAEDDALSITGTPTAANGTVVSNGDGTLTYTPNAGFVGSDVVTYQISDGTDTTTATLDVTVEAGNEAPVSVADSELVLDQGQSATTVDVLANDTDAEGETISVTGTPSAANGTVVDNGDGTLTYTPNDGFFGTDVISYEITDGTNTTAASLDVTVNERDYIVKGTAGDDVLDGSYIDVDSDVVTDGDDTIEGLGGDDILEGGAGADRLDGGDGIDTASYANAAAGVVANLADAAGNTGDAAGDAYTSIENLTGSAFADTLTGDAANNLLEGGAGDDVLAGAAGADTLTGGNGADNLDGGTDADNLSGGAGADTLLGGAGDDALSGGADDDLLIGGAGADLLDGGAGVDGTTYGDATAGVTVDLADASLNTGDAAGDTYVNLENVIGSSFADVLSGDSAANVLDGAAGNDTLSGREGDDTLLGGAGDDLLKGGTGADVMDGGDDIDRVTYAMAAAAVMVDLSGTTANAGEAVGDVITNVENLTGSAFGDTLTGSDDANEIDGGAGDDIINGGAGNDTIDGGDGDDIVGAGAGDDFVIAGPGADVLDGGDGFDVLSFQNADAPIEINLKNNKLDGPAAAVTFTNFEGFAGTEFADTMVAGKDDAVFYGLGGDDELTGHHGDDLLDGGTGNDDINGGKGEDTIIGGAGDDVLKGGTGDDVFIFNTGDGNDLITDFDKGKKSQDILQIDVAGFDSFADIEAAMTKDKGNTVIDLGNDQSITLQGVQPWQLTEDDFLFV